MAIGTKGRIEFGSDFTAGIDSQVPAATGEWLAGGIGLVGVNEGALNSTVDEPGGILDITTDVGDDDNEVLVAGAFKPADGGMWMECRFKIPDSVAAARAAVWIGFVETLSKTTPVMPSERATATTTFNNVGGMLGVMFDSDSTLLEFFGVAGDGQANLANKDYLGAVGNANGIQLTGAAGIPGGTIATADRFYIVRVEIDPNGLGRVYFGDYDGGASLTKPLKLVLENTTALGTGDNFHAIALIENRSAANERLEVDYFVGEAGRDWSAN